MISKRYYHKSENSLMEEKSQLHAHPSACAVLPIGAEEREIEGVKTDLANLYKVAKFSSRNFQMTSQNTPVCAKYIMGIKTPVNLFLPPHLSTQLLKFFLSNTLFWKIRNSLSPWDAFPFEQYLSIASLTLWLLLRSSYNAYKIKEVKVCKHWI